MPLPSQARNRTVVTDPANERIVANIERARSYALRIAQTWGGIDPDEAVAEAYAALVEAAHRYRDRGHTFWSYARCCVAGAVYDLAGRDAPLAFAESMLSVENSAERRSMLAETLARLDERSQDVLFEHYWNGCTSSRSLSPCS